MADGASDSGGNGTELILLTGATGLVGSAVLERLLSAGEGGPALRVLVAPGEPAEGPGGAEGIVGDLRAPETLSAALEGVNTVVSTASIRTEHRDSGRTHSAVVAEGTRNLADAARAAGATRMVHVSTLAAGPEARHPEFRTQTEAEAAVTASGLEHVVIRPGALFGSGTRLERILSRWAVGGMPLTLLPGQAETALQPVALKDVAEAAARAAAGRVEKGTYDMAGPEKVLFIDLIERTLDAAERAPARLHFPMPLLRAIGFDSVGLGPLPRRSELAYLSGAWMTANNRAHDLLGRRPETVSGWIDKRFGKT